MIAQCGANPIRLLTITLSLALRQHCCLNHNNFEACSTEVDGQNFKEKYFKRELQCSVELNDEMSGSEVLQNHLHEKVLTRGSLSFCSGWFKHCHFGERAGLDDALRSFPAL